MFLKTSKFLREALNFRILGLSKGSSRVLFGLLYGLGECCVGVRMSSLLPTDCIKYQTMIASAFEKGYAANIPPSSENAKHEMRLYENMNMGCKMAAP